MASSISSATEVRNEYTSARLISANLEHRLAGTRYPRPKGYLPPEIDYQTEDGLNLTVSVRDYDVRFLDRVAPEAALEHLDLIHRARRGDAASAAELRKRTLDTQARISARFAGRTLVETEAVIPYTTAGVFTEAQISHKGGILLDLSRRGFATADFNLVSAAAFKQPGPDLERSAREAVRNLEILSGRALGDPSNPLLIAMRSALPEYVPGFMPTYLNVCLTPDVFPGLPFRYGEEAAALIRLNNRKTILEALDPEAFRTVEKEVRPNLGREESAALALRIEELIGRRNPRLLVEAMAQVQFFLDRTYWYYEAHLDVLRNFTRRETLYPTVIFQRMEIGRAHV